MADDSFDDYSILDALINSSKEEYIDMNNVNDLKNDQSDKNDISIETEQTNNQSPADKTNNNNEPKIPLDNLDITFNDLTIKEKFDKLLSDQDNIEDIDKLINTLLIKEKRETILNLVRDNNGDNMNKNNPHTESRSTISEFYEKSGLIRYEFSAPALRSYIMTTLSDYENSLARSLNNTSKREEITMTKSKLMKLILMMVTMANQYAILNISAMKLTILYNYQDNNDSSISLSLCQEYAKNISNLKVETKSLRDIETVKGFNYIFGNGLMSHKWDISYLNLLSLIKNYLSHLDNDLIFNQNKDKYFTLYMNRSTLSDALDKLTIFSISDIDILLNHHFSINQGISEKVIRINEADVTIQKLIYKRALQRVGKKNRFIYHVIKILSFKIEKDSFLITNKGIY